MASCNLTIDVKRTEAFTLLLGMKDDMQKLIDLVPDYHTEKAEATTALNEKWVKMVELVEISNE